MTPQDPAAVHVDVLIVGAGLSGIGAAHHLQAELPDTTYTILEARDAIGGTWDLFRYPGARSGSDMQTLGYRFRPWTDAKAIADGPAILEYVRATAAEAGIDRHIRFGLRAVTATWSTADARWTVQAQATAESAPNGRPRRPAVRPGRPGPGDADSADRMTVTARPRPARAARRASAAPGG